VGNTPGSGTITKDRTMYELLDQIQHEIDAVQAAIDENERREAEAAEWLLAWIEDTRKAIELGRMICGSSDGKPKTAS